ncbi:hypothetical protein [Paenibacillus sp. NAIST15-1]|uniref:hypothetical protein n=1 Tax=Paenibacillus sp. NAIST15-1 TaxID=1605994 RepID=UPI001D10E64D|nr:hypothetical protein [Paenibacillus sp. NAIST15-1]
MKSSSSQSFPTSLLLSALLLFLMISIGIIFTSDAGVKHTETGDPLFIASDRQTGTVKI